MLSSPPPVGRLILACSIALAGCGGTGLPGSPSSPSTLTSPMVPSGPATPAARTSAYGDPYDYDYGDPMPDPYYPPPNPLPGPGSGPITGPAPTPDPGATPGDPTAATVTIVGSVGPAAFNPNPTTITAGQKVVWTNSDATRHHIMLGDGTMVGDLAPGQSSAPITVTGASMSFLCTIHPSMTGTLFDAAAAPQPAPPPAAVPPPIEDPGPYVSPY